jgi:2-phospho-L-lactate/phosphoenolpyruvate guanylyltransferase
MRGDATEQPMRWTVLVPLKSLPAAKSRLASTLGADGRPHLHAALVEAMRADVLRAARATPQVARVLVVSDQPGAGDLAQRSPGLNGALRDGAEYSSAHWPADGIAALVGDVPALHPEELAAALDSAAQHAAAFVPDAAATGTTLLTARPGTPLTPEFGAGSAHRHGRHAAALHDAGAGLRQDVDTAADLDAALALGVGPATGALFDAMPGSR